MSSNKTNPWKRTGKMLLEINRRSNYIVEEEEEFVLGLESPRRRHGAHEDFRKCLIWQRYGINEVKIHSLTRPTDIHQCLTRARHSGERSEPDKQIS